MMSFLIILTGIVLMLIVKKMKLSKEKKIIVNIILIFFITILFLSTFNPMGLYEVNYYVYLLWIICIVMFTMGYCSVKEKKIENKILDIDIISKSRVLEIIGYILLIALVFFRIRYINIANTVKDASELRLIRFTTLFNSYAENLIFNYIIVGILNIYTILLAILLVEKKYTTKLFWIALISNIVYITIGYGRKKLMDIIIYLIIWFIIKNKGKIKIKKGILLKGSLILILVFIVSISATAVRTGVRITNFEKIKNDIVGEQIEQYVIYFLGGFRSLDKYLENDINYTYGRLTLGGIDELISIPFLALGYDYSAINSIVGEKLQSVIHIGDNIEFNAFYTCVMNFYTDFHLLGVIIIPLIYGFILRKSMDKGINQKNLFDVILMLYLISNTVAAIYKWFYQSGSTMFTIIILLVAKLTLEIKGKEENGNNKEK